MDIATRLREAIGPAHSAIEELPLSRAMIDGRVCREDYSALLGQLWFVHHGLEAELKCHKELLAIYRPETMDRAAVILRDLAELGTHGGAAAPLESTLSLVRSISDRSAERPWALLGYLYVLEGSRMGSMALARPLAKALGVPAESGVGLDYHRDGMATRVPQWMRFKSVLLALPLGEEDQGEVVSSAIEMMEGLCGLYAALSCSEMTVA
jgi:heme oxygenase